MTEQDEHELEWWRKVFLCRLGPESVQFRVGEALYGRRFTLVEDEIE